MVCRGTASPKPLRLSDIPPEISGYARILCFVPPLGIRGLRAAPEGHNLGLIRRCRSHGKLFSHVLTLVGQGRAGHLRFNHSLAGDISSLLSVRCAVFYRGDPACLVQLPKTRLRLIKANFGTPMEYIGRPTG